MISMSLSLALSFIHACTHTHTHTHTYMSIPKHTYTYTYISQVSLWTTPHSWTADIYTQIPALHPHLLPSWNLKLNKSRTEFVIHFSHFTATLPQNKTICSYPFSCLSQKFSPFWILCFPHSFPLICQQALLVLSGPSYYYNLCYDSPGPSHLTLPQASEMCPNYTYSSAFVSLGSTLHCAVRWVFES